MKSECVRYLTISVFCGSILILLAGCRGDSGSPQPQYKVEDTRLYKRLTSESRDGITVAAMFIEREGGPELRACGDTLTDLKEASRRYVQWLRRQDENYLKEMDPRFREFSLRYSLIYGD